MDIMKLNIRPNNPKTAKLICNTLFVLILVWTFCKGASTFLTTMVYFLDGLWLSLSLQLDMTQYSDGCYLVNCPSSLSQKDKDIILLFDICFAV